MALRKDWIVAVADSWSQYTATDQLAEDLQVLMKFHIGDPGESGGGGQN